MIASLSALSTASLLLCQLAGQLWSNYLVLSMFLPHYHMCSHRVIDKTALQFSV